MKPTINYEVREQKDPSTGTAVYVPAIVDRNQTVDLLEVVTEAIDRGRIVAVKPNAAVSIAEGIAEELYHQFSRGNGIAFGKYFYGRLYLDGTAEKEGTLAPSRNRVNVRLIKGEDFKLALSDFSWHNIDATSRVTINNIQTIGGSVANTLISGQMFAVYGTNLGMVTGDTLKASWDAGGEEPATVTLTPSEVDNAHIKVAWPSAFEDLDEGTEITFTLVNHPDGAEGGTATTTHLAVIA